MFTGDVIDHANWERTVQSNTADFELAMNMLRSAFSDKVLLPILGNHESIPANRFIVNFKIKTYISICLLYRVAAPEWGVPENLTNQWLFQLAADIWGQWMPETESTILKGGFYSYEINPDLKIVALNNNFCYTSNWFV